MDQHTCPLCGCDGAGRANLASSVAYRFWSKVDVRSPGECWPWQRSIGVSGHGRFRMPADAPHQAGKAQGAHRVAYWLHTGVWPGAHVVRHRCDNPPCVNPGHLLLGSQADNVADKIERGRQPANANSLKTKCVRGHEFTPENTAIDSTGRRQCRKCRVIRHRTYRQRRRERSLATS